MYTAASMLAKARSNQIYGKIHDNDRRYYRNVYLNSEHWKNLRAEKLQISPKCEKCGSYLSLDVHHKSYGQLYDVLIQDLETLCRACHNKEHEEKESKKDRKLRKGLKREDKYYFLLYDIFHSYAPNIFLINWLLDSIIEYCSYVIGKENLRSHQRHPRQKYLGKRDKKILEINKKFDERFRGFRRDMDNYVSIHY
jgi:hypothetical protein